MENMDRKIKLLNGKVGKHGEEDKIYSLNSKFLLLLYKMFFTEDVLKCDKKL